MNTELTRQAAAARDLLAAYKDIIGDDEDFAMDVVEGQTDFVEIVNALAAQEGLDKANVIALEDYADKLIARARRIDARIDRRRNALLLAMQTAGLKTLRCPLATVGLRDTPQKAVPTDLSKISDEFWKPAERTLDRRALLAALKEGPVPGAELSNGGVAISIRTN